MIRFSVAVTGLPFGLGVAVGVAAGVGVASGNVPSDVPVLTPGVVSVIRGGPLEPHAASASVSAKSAHQGRRMTEVMPSMMAAPRALENPRSDDRGGAEGLHRLVSAA